MSDAAARHATTPEDPDAGHKALAEIAAAVRTLRDAAARDKAIRPLVASALLRLNDATRAAELVAARQLAVDVIFAAGRDSGYTDGAATAARRRRRSAAPGRLRSV